MNSYKIETFISERLDAYCRQQDILNACRTLNRDCSETWIFRSAPISSSPRSLQFLWVNPLVLITHLKLLLISLFLQD